MKLKRIFGLYFESECASIYFCEDFIKRLMEKIGYEPKFIEIKLEDKGIPFENVEGEIRITGIDAGLGGYSEEFLCKNLPESGFFSFSTEKEQISTAVLLSII